MKNKFKILMASAEAFPFAKAGGLADVVGSLPKELKNAGHDVRVILPKYGLIDEKKYKLKKSHSNILVSAGRIEQNVNIWQGFLPGTKVQFYFLEEKKYFGFKDIYISADNTERFLFFSMAVLQILDKINFQPNIIHSHDYHAAMINFLIKHSDNENIKSIKTIYTIHNLAYQGKAKGNLLKKFGFKLSDFPRKNKVINFMEQGIVNADIINTVSPTYAQEIKKKEYGVGLEKVIRKRNKNLYGVINGIDINLFNPSKDKNIIKYSASNLTGKEKNKEKLRKMFNLEKNNKPLIALVSRLVWQKGLDLINEEILNLDAQFIFLGTGDKKIEKTLSNIFKNKQNARLVLDFNLKLAQQLYAGSDFFLMPSRFEPCGLGQMIAMRYGSLPIVRATGGLADTVDAKVGVFFHKISPKALKNAIKKAIKIYQQPVVYKKMQKQAMSRDFSWKRSAKEYEKIYKKLFR